jgi:integrase
MAISCWPRKTKEGDTYHTATIRVAPFKSETRSSPKDFPTLKALKAWAEERERELQKLRKKGNVRGDVTQLTVAGLIKEFLEDPETRQLETYSDVSLLCAEWVNLRGNEKALQFTNVLLLRKARATLQKGGRRGPRANGTVNRYLSAGRSCWNWARSAGVVPTDMHWPDRGLMLSEPKGRVRYLEDDELPKIREAVRAYSPTLYALTMVSIATGVRQGELLRLKWADVDFARSRVKVMLAKNDEARGVFLPATAMEALQALRIADVVSPTHLFLDKDGDPFDKNKLRYRWKQARSTAVLKDFRWHDLRHCCASYLAQNGATLLEIGAVLGHKSPSATMRYAHLVQGAPVTGHAALDKKLRDS